MLYLHCEKYCKERKALDIGNWALRKRPEAGFPVYAAACCMHTRPRLREYSILGLVINASLVND